MPTLKSRATHRGTVVALAMSCPLLANCSVSDGDVSFVGGPTGSGTQTGGGSNVSLGGSQDIGFFRGELEAGRVPPPEALDDAGFFAEHHSELPPASCGNRICLTPMLGTMGNLLNGETCTMLQLSLVSPLAADPGARPPLSLAVVVDVSGSMQGQKIDFVRDGLGRLIDGMKDGDRLSLVTYADSARVAATMQEVAENRGALRDSVNGLVAQGATNLSEGLRLGYQQVLAGYESDRQNRVILLSDGNPTAGITNPTSIIELSRAYNSDGIGLSTIGLGSDFNISLMRDLALQADGNFYFLEDSGAVREVFDEELDFFVVPVAFDLKLSLKAGAGYDFGRAYGSPLWQDTTRGGELDVPSVFLAHRQSADDVTEDDGRRGGGSQLLVELMANGIEPGGTTEVATIDVEFREPGSDELVSDAVTVTTPFRPGEVRSQGYFAADDVSIVQKSFVMLNIFVGMERAVTDFAAGDADATTISELDSLIAAVVDYNEEISDKDIELDLELLQMLRANLRARQVPEGSSEVPSNPWPAD